MIRRPPRSTPLYSSAASDVYKRQDLKVSVDTVMSEITVSSRLFQIVGEAWQKALLEKLRTAGLYCRMLAPQGNITCQRWADIFTCLM